MPTYSGSDPDRAAWVSRTTTALVGRLMEQAFAQLAEPSTDSLSLEERTFVRLLRPILPKLRARVSSKLSEQSPEGIERMAGALATTLEELLAAAPGRPLVRHRAGWAPDGSLVLVPVERMLEREETCGDCLHAGGRHDSLVGCTELVNLEGQLGNCPCRRPGCGCDA